MVVLSLSQIQIPANRSVLQDSGASWIYLLTLQEYRVQKRSMHHGCRKLQNCLPEPESSERLLNSNSPDLQDSIRQHENQINKEKQA
jgi:hypothetical protein